MLDVWPIFEAVQFTYVCKGVLLEQGKTPPRARRMVLRLIATDSAKPA